LVKITKFYLLRVVRDTIYSTVYRLGTRHYVKVTARVAPVQSYTAAAAAGAGAGTETGAGSIKIVPGAEFCPTTVFSYSSGDGSMPPSLAAAVDTMRVVGRCSLNLGWQFGSRTDLVEGRIRADSGRFRAAPPGIFLRY
jgi:hypothetical protein